MPMPMSFSRLLRQRRSLPKSQENWSSRFLASRMATTNGFTAEMLLLWHGKPEKAEEAEIIQANPVDTARNIYPIRLKAAIRGQGVVEWAGGWLIPLFKGRGRGNIHAMTGYRAILLESTFSRAGSRACIPLVVRGLEHITTPLQCGGRPGVCPSRHFTCMFTYGRHMHVRPSNPLW